MANTVNADELTFQRHLRAFSQRGGPRPNNQIRYAGADEQYLSFGDMSDPVRGGVNAVRRWDPYQRDAYTIIGTSQQVPDLPSGQIMFARRHGGISWIAGDLRCPNNYYELAGVCERPDDFGLGWSDFMTIYSHALATTRTYTKRTSDTADDMLMDTVDHVFGAIYDLGGLSFGENASTQVERETIAVTYGGASGCGTCGVTDDGSKWIYALNKSSGAGSPGTPAEIVWSIDGGGSYQQTNITGLGGTVDPTGIAQVGPYLVVIDTTGGGYWYAEVDTFTGTPSNWTFVSTGFVAGSAPTDIYAFSTSEVYFAARSGRIYRSRDISAGVSVVNDQIVTTQHFTRIKGNGDTIVAVGELGAVAITRNRGSTWAAPIDDVTTDTITAVDVLDEYRYWVGTYGGKVFYTINGGVTWVEQAFPGAVRISDIAFATDEVGWIAGNAPNLTTGRLWTTYCGGAQWISSSISRTPRIRNFLTATRLNRIAVPLRVDPKVAANRILLGGLAGGGTDGILIQGLPTLK